MLKRNFEKTDSWARKRKNHDLMSCDSCSSCHLRTLFHTKRTMITASGVVTVEKNKIRRKQSEFDTGNRQVQKFRFGGYHFDSEFPVSLSWGSTKMWGNAVQKFATFQPFYMTVFARFPTGSPFDHFRRSFRFRLLWGAHVLKLSIFRSALWGKGK